jgi:hypothetical protein
LKVIKDVFCHLKVTKDVFLPFDDVWK